MNTDVIKVFIGFDPVESVAWHTMVHSIIEKSSKPIAIIPINLKNLSKIFTRKKEETQSNEFSFTRFLVPYLCDFKGKAIYFDCDMLLRKDIVEIFDVIIEQSEKAVYVVKHDYESKDTVKYLNKIQYKYPRKNWSSVVLWNCAHPSNNAVTLDYVNTATGSDLHRFKWLKDDEIGELNIRWNWLVGEYDEPPYDVSNVHWTVGGPYFNEYRNVDFADEWFSMRDKMLYCKQR
jgi:lipopolysaccharide biosynthesis glycosyltransferase